MNNVGNLSGAGAGIPRRRHQVAAIRPAATARDATAKSWRPAQRQRRRRLRGRRRWRWWRRRRFGRGGGGKPGIDRPYFYNELIGTQGGHTALMLAARSGYVDAAKTLVAAGADVNQISVGDKTSPLLIAAINGHFDLAKWLLDQGANPERGSGQRRDAALCGAERARGRRARCIRSRARSISSRSPISTS